MRCCVGGLWGWPEKKCPRGGTGGAVTLRAGRGTLAPEMPIIRRIYVLFRERTGLDARSPACLVVRATPLLNQGAGTQRSG